MTTPSPTLNPAPTRILLVEDSPSDVELLKASLEEAGPGQFTFTCAERWAEAVGCLRAAPFDVLLLDLTLPDSTGRETFRQARVEAPQLAIVVLTGIVDEAVALEALRQGIQDYLIKGQMDGHQTARAIRYAIERSRVERALKQAEAALRESERQLREANLELEHRVAARTAQLAEMVTNLEDFSHSITHDLRAPLRAMRAFAQFLREECSACGKPAAQDYSLRIITAAARMDRLIQDVLQYSRLTHDELKLIPVDVAALLHGIIQSYPAFHAPRVEIVVEEPLPQVMGNEAALTQCFSNLLDNAVKFVAPHTRPHVRIWAEHVGNPKAKGRGSKEAQSPKFKVGSSALEVQSSKSDKHDKALWPPHETGTAANPMPSGMTLGPASASDLGLRTLDFPLVRLWFEDNGIGIPEAAHGSIFKLFQRLDKAHEGTGVGLTVVRKAVERMGGKVGLESKPGRGSRFWLDLHRA
jgi:signal transduction histidine kinase